MLVFIDESGDAGIKTERGSSKFFVISLVIFNNFNEATDCSRRIDLLRQEMRLNLDFEFHFRNNSLKIRERFLRAVVNYNFCYFCLVVDKSRLNFFYSINFTKESFYQCACRLLFLKAKSYLKKAIIVLDRSGSPEFCLRLSKVLKIEMSQQKGIIKKIKQQNSNSNNLLQLADYVAGIINRKFQNKKNWQLFHDIIRKKEISIQFWPN